VFVVGTGLCEFGGESCNDDVVDSEIVLVSESELRSVLFCCSDSVVEGVSCLWMYLEFHCCVCMLAACSFAARSAMSSLYSFLDVEIFRVASLVESVLWSPRWEVPPLLKSH